MSKYDFIVVGSGSAGSVLASRLSENPDAKILVLEAGGPKLHENVDVPQLWFTLFGSDIDWKYQSVPQPGLEGRQTYEPRGKAPGGSSNFYIMMHIRGARSDYDNWAYNGCPGWGYDDVLPYFQKLEDQDDYTSAVAGHGGPIPVNNAGKHKPNPTSQAFIDACVELGYPRTEDFNGPKMEGAGWHHINVKDGLRWSSRKAYLEPAVKRPNVTFITNAQVTRLLFDAKRCTGVEYSHDGKLETADVRHEVILCAGAIESPHVLLNSGIGDPTQLRQFGVSPLADLPGVGENFHNHVLTGVINECAQQVPMGNQNLSEAALFLQSEPGWMGPDLQIAFVHVPFNIIIGQGHPNSVSILPGVVRPMSRGWIRLGSGDPLHAPLINPNYLSAESDVERLVYGVKLARDIFATKAFSTWIKQELMPGPDVHGHSRLREFVRQNADSYHHQAGSCKMGSDNMAVVDPQLRVYGVEGVRIADASVMPVVPSGNCHAGILMIAEKCADLIKAEYGMGADAKKKHDGKDDKDDKKKKKKDK